MATGGLAAFHNSATHAARVVRNAFSAVFMQPIAAFGNNATARTRGGSYGVVNEGDLLVTSTGGLGYSVAAGRVVGPGTTATAQGLYLGYNDAAVTGSVGARDASNPRIDYIAYRVRDQDEDATGSEDDGIVVIAGTPAASPSPPSIPSSLGTLVILAEVLVPTGVTALTFTDRRFFATAVGGVIPCTSSTRPTNTNTLRHGQPIAERDTGNRYWWSASVGAFRGAHAQRATSTGTSVSGTFGVGSVVDTITLPDAGCAGTWTILVYLHVLQSAGGDQFEADVTQAGSSVGYSRTDMSASTFKYMCFPLQGIGVAAGDTPTVNVTLRRVSGAGTATTSAIAYLNRMEAFFWPNT
jgi:hypothetical protein